MRPIWFEPTAAISRPAALLPANPERRIVLTFAVCDPKNVRHGRSTVGRNPMQVSRTRAVKAVIAIGAVGACLGIGNAQAQAPAAQGPVTAASNDLQRSVEIYGYNAAAKSGATRGEV